MTQPQPETQEDMVEKVAQGIADAQFGGPFNRFEWPEAWAHFEVLARAALSASHDTDVVRMIVAWLRSEADEHLIDEAERAAEALYEAADAIERQFLGRRGGA